MGRGGDEGAAGLSLRTRARSSLGFVCLDEADDPSDQRLELAVAADQVRAREAILELACQGVGVVAQQNGAYAPIAPCDENRSERTLADGETDRHLCTARARRQLAQCGRRIRALDQAAELGDLCCVLLGERALIGLATPAGAEARLLRIGRGGMECDVLGPRGTRAAGRATTADQRGSLVVVAASVLLRGARGDCAVRILTRLLYRVDARSFVHRRSGNAPGLALEFASADTGRVGRRGERSRGFAPAGNEGMAIADGPMGRLHC